jgi:hypothetical protein
VNDFERGLKELGERAGDELPGELRPRPGALRRVALRRRLLAGGVALCSALVVLGGVVVAGGRGENRRALPPAEEHTQEPVPPDRAEECGVPFAPTYVPPGFASRARPGSGGAPGRGGAIAHFAGPAGRVIDVWAGEQAFVGVERIGIEVLGRRAVLGAVHDGYSVDFRTERCGYQLLAYGVTREELRDFAEGLVGVAPSAGSYFGAVWPEDTVGETRRGCSDRTRAQAALTARSFVETVMLWQDAEIVVEGASPGQRELAVHPAPGEVDDPSVSPGLRLTMRQVLPGCWSVVSVSPLEQRRVSALGVGVDGGTAEIVFERYGATSAKVEFGYGTYTSLTHWHAGGEEVTSLQVEGAERSTGHFLVVLLDENGDAFAAIGRPLPPGDFAAG